MRVGGLPDGGPRDNLRSMPASFIRLIAVAWAVAVAAMPGVLALADARVEAASQAAASSHVESLGGTGCAPVHDAECGICSSLRLLAGTSARVSPPRSSTGGSAVTVGRGGTQFATSHGWPESQPRAPPAV